MAGDRLTLQDRRRIAEGLRDGSTYAAIGRRIGRPTSTVTREITRNGGARGYHAEAAHRAGAQPARRPKPTPPAPPGPDPGERDPRLIDEVDAQSTELMIQAGLPPMMARVLAALFTTDSGSLTSAELVRRLRVSPASISKAVGYLESQALITRGRDPRGRVERYSVDDDVAFLSIMASARVQTRIAEACASGAEKLGPTTPAGARLETMSRFLHHVIDDLVHSVQHWRQVYATRENGEDTPA
ncbi:MarR family transcriptional regulator [Actinorhabdospora filicis]|uniref:MarR family transcriptional regulator n=1 Tax=Actinorhabdospora filicis TaxID=1785913 RepID=A0A9W6WB95_9ACTN|nr:helix-turn-helix domain-containing protein [Actinorhabdospora filicis]GLZ78500.1 MarR family transcriptional regulator [Actinorhabdospora filicis]